MWNIFRKMIPEMSVAHLRFTVVMFNQNNPSTCSANDCENQTGDGTRVSYSMRSWPSPKNKHQAKPPKNQNLNWTHRWEWFWVRRGQTRGRESSPWPVCVLQHTTRRGYPPPPTNYHTDEKKTKKPKSLGPPYGRSIFEKGDNHSRLIFLFLTKLCTFWWNSTGRAQTIKHPI